MNEVEVLFCDRFDLLALTFGQILLSDLTHHLRESATLGATPSGGEDSPPRMRGSPPWQCVLSFMRLESKNSH